MPRLTNQSYLLQCHQVRDHWRDDSKNAFFLLTPTEQWTLFTYFAPSEKLTDNELIIHREDISSYDPSLPQRAGRALSKLWAASKRLEDYRAQVIPMPRPRMAKNTERRIYIFSEVNLAPDPVKMAQILMDYKRCDQWRSRLQNHLRSSITKRLSLCLESV
jgi:hypothetical protein